MVIKCWVRVNILDRIDQIHDIQMQLGMYNMIYIDCSYVEEETLIHFTLTGRR